VVIATLRPLTHEDLVSLPDDGNRYEIINGELIVTPAPLVRHQRVVVNLAVLLRLFLTQHNIGEVLVAPFDVVLGPNDVVQPDLLVIGSEQGRLKDSQNAFEGSPRLVVEILSPSSQRTDLVRKMALYARTGVPEYWMVDPERHEIAINVLAGGVYVPVAQDEFGAMASRVLPGLRLDPTEVFADLD
jgi:Uma2 family endonuclease